MLCAAPAARRDAVTRVARRHSPTGAVTESSSVRACCDDARGSSATRTGSRAVTDAQHDEDQVQARIAATNALVDYMHGEGSEVARDTLAHATAMAQVLLDAGLLINPRFQVAISPTRLNALKHAEVTLGALEAAGVDNWEGYDDAITELHSAGDDAQFGNVL